MPLVIMQRALITWLGRCLIVIIAGCRLACLFFPGSDVSWLQLCLVGIVRVGCIWRVNLVQVLIESFLALETCQVASCILVFCDAVLGNGTRTDLPAILPVTLSKETRDIC